MLFGEHVSMRINKEKYFVKYLGESFLTCLPNMDWIFFDMSQDVVTSNGYLNIPQQMQIF
jgi:hypothetical protein